MYVLVLVAAVLLAASISTISHRGQRRNVGLPIGFMSQGENFSAAAGDGGYMLWASYINRHPENCPGTPDAPCLIPSGISVLIADEDIRVRSMRVQGQLRIEAVSAGSRVSVDTAFLLVDGSGASVHIDASRDQTRSATIYLRNNPASYRDIPVAWNNSLLMQGRALAVIGENATMTIDGFPLTRTWTLLERTAIQGDRKIFVQGDISDWLPGHIIALAPTDHPAMWDVPDTGPTSFRIGPEVFTIINVKAVPGSMEFEICLNSTIRNPYLGGNSTTGIQAEVLNLNRTVVITGDEFSNNSLPLAPILRAGETPPYYFQQFPTTSALVEGLHTIAANKSILKFRYARVERGGQRGYVGHYPVHMHYLGECPECQIVGLAVVDSHQRGIVIHQTHLATVRDNVLYAVRGAGIYIEEGVEIGNVIQDNVYLCHEARLADTYLAQLDGKWVQGDNCLADGATPDKEFGNPARVLGGCRIVGTDNVQADCVQQAAIWALSATNDFLGNRAVNAYNGIYFQSTLFLNGRQDQPLSFHRVYPLSNPMGIMRNNVCHSCYRFGWYPDTNWPSQLDRSVDTGGLVVDLAQFVPNVTAEYPCITDFQSVSGIAGPHQSWCSARWYKADGTDNGQTPAAVVEGGLDYGNQYVGQYNIANVQYRGHRSIHNSAAAFYLKNTKDFIDHRTSLIVNSTFEYGRADANTGIVTYKAAAQDDVASAMISLPGASAAYVLENIILRGNLAANNISGDPYNKVGSFAAAIGINQECKWPVHDPQAHLCRGPCYPTIEGGLCNPTVLLVNVSLTGVTAQARSHGPTSWLKFGIMSGNPFTGSVNAIDDSLCGDDEISFQCRQAPFRSVSSKFSAHLLALPSSPCMLASGYGPTWHQRFDGGIVCTVPLRRLDIWTPDQSQDLLLLPPGCSLNRSDSCGYRSGWLAFNDVGSAGSPAEEWAQFAEGYPFVVIANESYPSNPDSRWAVVKADGTPLNPAIIKAVEFSDLIFGTRFGVPETLELAFPGVGNCTARSDDARLWITQYGAVRKGGGSCVSLWDKQAWNYLNIDIEQSMWIFRYGTSHPGSKNWIGVYDSHDTPGTSKSVAWAWAIEDTGQVKIDYPTDSGQFTAYFLVGDTAPFGILAGPVDIWAGGYLRVTTQGSMWIFRYGTSSPNGKNWIGVYESHNTPGTSKSVAWAWASEDTGQIMIHCPADLGPVRAYFLGGDTAPFTVLAGPIDVPTCDH